MRTITTAGAGAVVLLVLTFTVAATFGLVAGLPGAPGGGGCAVTGGSGVAAGDTARTGVTHDGVAGGLRILDRVRVGAGSGAAAGVALWIDGRRPRWGAQLSPVQPVGTGAGPVTSTGSPGSEVAGSGATGSGAGGAGASAVMLIAALAVAAAAAGGAVATARAPVRASATPQPQRVRVPRDARSEQVYGMPAHVRSCS